MSEKEITEEKKDGMESEFIFQTQIFQPNRYQEIKTPINHRMGG